MTFQRRVNLADGTVLHETDRRVFSILSLLPMLPLFDDSPPFPTLDSNPVLVPSHI